MASSVVPRQNHAYTVWSIQQLSVINTHSHGLGLTHSWVEILYSLSLVFSHNESVLAKQLPVRHGRVKLHSILGRNELQFCWAAISSSLFFLSGFLFCLTAAFSEFLILLLTWKVLLKFQLAPFISVFFLFFYILLFCALVAYYFFCLQTKVRA